MDLEGMDESGFRAGTRTQDAVVRQLEITGEATERLPQGIRRRSPDTSWKDIAGARDGFIHSCFGVDLQRAWNMERRDLPALKAAVSRLLEGDQEA